MDKTKAYDIRKIPALYICGDRIPDKYQCCPINTSCISHPSASYRIS